MNQKTTEKTTEKDTISFQNIISEISKIFRKNHLTYHQVKYVFSEARKKCGIKSEKKAKGAKEHLSKAEAKKLLDYAYSLKGDLGLLIKVLLFTGARVNEFVSIRIQDVYMADAKIYLSTTKGDKPRYVPIFEFYKNELKLYMDKENRKTGYLFESNRHDQYSTRRIQQIMKQLCKEVGIEKKITPHRLRATIATWLSEKGVKTEWIQDMLGHSKLATTQIYTKGSKRELKEIGDIALLGSD